MHANVYVYMYTYAYCSVLVRCIRCASFSYVYAFYVWTIHLYAHYLYAYSSIQILTHFCSVHVCVSVCVHSFFKSH